ncbi:ABC-2 type transport system permease protein [Streptomyces sp. 846.5]|nr:ABC transporter permease [Streptomyces sp. 846.5]TDU03173.1 ABC-2 type transport system permease protein [Streptomyces sp. 846.5]
MRLALHAEWTKLRTQPGTAALLIGVVVLTVGVSTGVAATATTASASDPAKLALAGVYLGQVVVATLSVLAIGGEYSTGMIRTTLGAMPRRWTVLAAKATLVAGAAAAAGVVAVLGSLVAGALILPGHGFTAAHGYPQLSPSDGAVLRAAVGSVLYFALIALLSLGVATAVRDSATAVGVVLALLFIFPIVASVVTDPYWQRHLQQIAPMTAGLAIQATTGLRSLPIGPWAGLGVLAAWAAGSLLAGGLLLRLRDA